MEQVSTNSSTVENNAKKLGLRELTSLAAGQVIGAGIVTLVGQAIGLTGRSVWLAYLTAVIIGFVIIIPYIMLSSMIRVKGGNYSFVASILGEKWGGMYGMAFTLNALACGMFGLAFATYLNSMVPGLNTKIVAVVVVTVFYVVNLMGVNFMAKIQSYMTITLFLGLGLFIVVGFTNLRPGTFAFSSPDFFTNGADGFIAAVLILIFSCTGHSFVVAYSGDSKKPRKDIPLAIILASGIILVLYTSVALVAGGVVPIKEAAGQPLTIVATKILGNPLSYIFVIGGPLAALTTTLNSSFGVFSKPVLQMSKDGWFPSRFARLNRYGSPYLVLTVLYAMAVIPVIAGLSIATITSNAVLIGRIADIVAIISILLVPAKLPEAWNNRYFKMAKPLYYSLIGFCFMVNIAVIVLTMKTLTPTLVTVTLSLIAVFVIYSTIRQKTGKVHMEKSYELQ